MAKITPDAFVYRGKIIKARVTLPNIYPLEPYYVGTLMMDQIDINFNKIEEIEELITELIEFKKFIKGEMK